MEKWNIWETLKKWKIEKWKNLEKWKWKNGKFWNKSNKLNIEAMEKLRTNGNKH